MIINISGWLSASYDLTSTATITVHYDADRILKSGMECPSSTSVVYAYFKAYLLSSPVRNGSATTWLTYDWIIFRVSLIDIALRIFTSIFNNTHCLPIIGFVLSVLYPYHHSHCPLLLLLVT